MMNRNAWRKALTDNLGKRAQIITIFDDPRGSPHMAVARPDPNLYPTLRDFDDECVVLEYEGTQTGLASVVRRAQIVAMHFYDPERWEERHVEERP